MNSMESVYLTIATISSNLIIIFKNVADEHRDIVQVFDSHEDTYLDHQSVLVQGIKHVWIQTFVTKHVRCRYDFCINSY